MRAKPWLRRRIIILVTAMGSLVICGDNQTLEAAVPPSPTFTITPTASVVTPPATVTPTATPDSLLIDNFENDHSFEDEPNARDAQWTLGNTEFGFSMASHLAGNNTSFLKVTYDKKGQDLFAWVSAAALEQAGNRTNYATEHILSMHIMGKVRLLLKFKEDEGVESQDAQFVIDSEGAWTKLIWDYSNLDWQACNPERVKEFVIIPAAGPFDAQGEFYLDNLTLGPGAPAPPTPMPVFPKGGYALPNPFLPARGQTTRIAFQTQNPQATYAIRIMNIKGQIVRELNNQQVWDGKNKHGHYCEGGVYIYQIEAEGQRISGQVVLIK